KIHEADAVLASMEKNATEEMKAPFFIAFAAAVDAEAGRPEKAKKVLADLEEIRKKTYVEPFAVLELCAALHDEKSLALWQRRMKEEHSTLYVYGPMFQHSYIDMVLERARQSK